MTHNEPAAPSSPGRSGKKVGDKHEKRDVLSIGFLPSPGLCERIISDLFPNMPETLAEHIDEQVTWELTVKADPLAGSNLGAPDLLQEVHDRAQANGWDYTICLSDLPIRRIERFILADVSIDRGIA